MPDDGTNTGNAAAAVAKLPDGLRKRPWLDYAAIGFLMVVLIVVMLRPEIAYAPVQRTLVFVLIGLMVAVASGRQVASSSLTIKAGWLMATYSGTVAAVIGLAYVMTRLSRPETAVAVYHVFTEANDPYPVNFAGTVDVKDTKSGIKPRFFVDDNTVVVIFPEQAPRIDIGIKFPPSSGKLRWTQITYGGSTETDLVIGDSLKLRGD